MTDAPRTRTMPTTFAQQEQTIKRLEAENKRLEAVAEEMVQLRYEQSGQRLAAETELLDAKTLLRKALMRLEGLNTLNVSIHPDVVTDDLIAEIRKLLEDAPETVKGGEK